MARHFRRLHSVVNKKISNNKLHQVYMSFDSSWKINLNASLNYLLLINHAWQVKLCNGIAYSCTLQYCTARGRGVVEDIRRYRFCTFWIFWEAPYNFCFSNKLPVYTVSMDFHDSSLYLLMFLRLHDCVQRVTLIHFN